MTPATLLSDLRQRGFSVRTEAGKLYVAPTDQLTDDDRAAVRQHKTDLLIALGLEQQPACWRDATAARMMAGVMTELPKVVEAFGAAGLVGQSLDLLADGLVWLADDVRERNAKAFAERAAWLAWLANEIQGWASGSVPLPPKEVT